jgi:hypothetical protein
MPKIHEPTEAGTPLRLVFVPSSHFTDAGGPGIGDYVPRVDTLWAKFSQHVFFRRYLSRVAAWRLDIPSGTDKRPNPAERDLFGNEIEVLNWVQSRVPQFNPENGDVIVFFVGMPAAGNVRGTSIEEKRGNLLSYEAEVSWVNMAIGGEGAFVHEFGHAFGHLGDEYGGNWVNTARPEYPNVAEQVPGYACQDKWGDMLDLAFHPHPDLGHLAGQYTGQIGCFANAHALNWYKPTDHACLMNQCGSEWPFCPVCHRHLEKLMHRYGRGELVITFDHYPDGAQIAQPVLLKGNEFLAFGVAFAPDPIHYAAGLSTQPAILPGGYGARGNCLAMVEEGNPQQHVSRNIHMAFDWPLKEVSVTFHGATARYHLEAYDENSNPIAISHQNAVLHQGPHRITVSDPQNRIRKVEFGEDQSITIITKLRYR